MVIWDGSLRKLIPPLILSWAYWYNRNEYLKFGGRQIMTQWRGHFPRPAPEISPLRPPQTPPLLLPPAPLFALSHAWNGDPKQPNNRKQTSTYQVFLVWVQADLILIDPIQTLKNKFINAFFFFSFKAQVVADGEPHIYIPSHRNWSSESLAGEGRAFSQTAFGLSPGGEGCRLEQGGLFLSQKSQS